MTKKNEKKVYNNNNIAISGIIVSSLMASEINSVDFNKYLIPQDLTSVSRSGTLPDKIATTDGIGTLMLSKVDMLKVLLSL